MGNYVVKQGDTIWGIARSLGIPTADLVKWNNLESNPNYIQVGQVLKLSADDTGGTKTTTNTTTDNSFKYDDFTYDDYKESDTVTQAKKALNAQLAQKPGEYNSQWQAQLDDTINKILNREKFSYDLNGDALYQQYKDKFIKQGKMAMGDAIGQASAMTGGYGNSYAQSVGQQAYQAQLENLNDIVPELYQMAYDKYNQEGQDLYNQYSMLGDRENMDYGRYRDTVSDWLTERDYLTDRYDSERTFDYGKYADDRDFSYEQYSDDRNLAYSDHRNTIEDEQWKKEYQLALDKFDYEKEKDDEKKNNIEATPTHTSNTTQQPEVSNPTKATTTTQQLSEQKIGNFKKSLSPESAHDAIARQMYGPYTAYVAVQLAKSNLTDEEKKYLITYYGITNTDLQYARDKGYKI